MNMHKIKVMLVDDHSILRTGLAALLSTSDSVEVVGDAETGGMALEKAPKLQPDVILMDLMMPNMDGTETTRRILEILPQVKVIILTTFGTADGIGHAIEAGASGALLKTIKLNELLTAIKTVYHGGQAFSPEIEQILATEPPLPALSARQTEILKSVIEGLTNKDIATRLGISSPMVNEHLNAIFAKIGAFNRTEAVAIAMRKHLLKM